ncbi:helix-turn-helix domain-containing protein [Neisseria yangbaofengii]|uniref:helix-turn-helix domain-containing protein n=1 Tax=Neisseria yangbaofengii TaxID=2709396 RepID=UPI0013ED3EC5|nr:helix-turn-helix transcriptional regulator [Neisseria yangbaofengii]
MDIQDKIRNIRKLQQLTIEDMAEKLNMSASGYAKIERGETKLQFEKLEQIAQVFNMDITELLAVGDKSIVLLMNENSDYSANYYSSNEAVVTELEKMKLIVAHKDELLQQKENEISALKEIIGLLKQK